MAVGTIRVEASTLQPFKKTVRGWKKISVVYPNLRKAVALFAAHNAKAMLVGKDSRWLKGQLGPLGQVQGARVMSLPNGEMLDKGFSLFAANLKLHDQTSHDHWDVLYQNKGGTWAYCYTKKKVLEHKNRKFKKVQKFAKVYTLLCSNVTKGLRDRNDFLALPMLTLLRTNMRVGNETYYKAHGHKGLTTLMKKDVAIKGRVVTFKYKGKDGVPQLKSAQFPASYVRRMQNQLKKLRAKDFVFSSNGRPLPEREFKKAFLRYCGKEFYPHIVRSHYATAKVKSFLKGKRKASKDEVNSLYLGIAAELGHKKFSKKTGKWEESYAVTVGHYIQPELVERVSKIVR